MRSAYLCLASTLALTMACGWGKEADHGVCPDYLACADAAGESSATLVAMYGEDGTCWSDGDRDEAQLCRANCTDLLAAAVEAHADLPECVPIDPDEVDAIDLLVLVDASSSMQDEAGAFALGLDALFDELEGRDVQAIVAGLDEGTEFERIQTVVDNADDLRHEVLCSGTCFLEEPPSDPGYDCGDATDTITREYLDCECGEDAWLDHCGAGTEEGLDSALVVMCRTAEAPPALCERADAGTDPGFLREDATLVVVLISDEGDTSRQMTQNDGNPAVYIDAYDAFDLDYVWNVIGPNTETCNDAGATTWGVQRYQEMTSVTDGIYADLRTGSSCDLADFEDIFADMAAAL